MNIQMKRLPAFLLCLLLCLGAFPAAAGAESPDAAEEDEIRLVEPVEVPLESEDETVVSVTDFGADGSDQEDDYSAFLRAVKSALDNSGTTRIRIPAGVYYLSWSLPVYSDTILDAEDGAQMVCSGSYSGPMLYGAHLNDSGRECYGSSCTHGGYTQAHDVTLSGGVWDRNDDGSSNSSVLSFRHAERIRFLNLTVRNATNHHLNLSGSADILIEGCRIENAVYYTGSGDDFWTGWPVGNMERYDFIEAVHLDYCGGDGEESDRVMPYDNTPACRVLVKDCVFSKVHTAVGNHHNAPDTRPSDIQVVDCTANDMRAYLLYAQDFDDFVLSGNTVTDSGALCTVWNCTGRIEDNTISCKSYSGSPDKNAIYLNYGALGEISVRGNTLDGARAAGVQLNRGARADCSGNTITSPVTHAFLVTDGSELTAQDNILKNIAGETFGFSDQCRGTIRNNTITDVSKHALVASDGCEIVFSGNKVDGCASEAVRVMSNSSLTAEDNDMGGIAYFGIYVTDGTALILGNTIRDTGNEYPAIRAERCPGAVVDGNVILSSDNNGIAVNTCDNARISNNKLSGVRSRGIHINVSTGVQVWGNTVRSAGDYGLLIEGSSSSDYSSAYIFNNYFSSTDSYDMRLGRYARNCVLANNTLAHNKASYDSTSSYKTQAYLFTDVLDSSKYYYTPVYWAAERGITKGYDDGSFGHDLDCTRAHIVTFLWRLKGKPEPGTASCPFPDVRSGAYYYKAVLWAVEKKITNGFDDGSFRPDEPCTREQAMTFLWRMAGKPNPRSASNPFADLRSSDYFYKAVLWASENGVAKGYTSGEYAGKYGVGLPCLREHVVTFLYRYYNNFMKNPKERGLSPSPSFVTEREEINVHIFNLKY